MHASLGDDEAKLHTLREAFSVRHLVIRDNTIVASATSGIEVGAGKGPVRGGHIEHNVLRDIRGGAPIAIREGVHCSGNRVDDTALAVTGCDAGSAASSITGAGG